MRQGTAQLRMADRLAGGNLAAILSEARAANESYESITSRLYAEYGIEATRATVTNWCRLLGADAEDGAA